MLKKFFLSAAALRIILGSMFLLSAALKGTDVVRFDRLIESILKLSSTPIVSNIADYSGGIAWIILLLEIVIGAMLLSAVRIRLAAIVSLFTLTIFTIITIKIGDSAGAGSCGCFGILLPRSTMMSVIENIVFMTISAALIFSPHRKEKSYPRSATALMLAGIVWMGLFYVFPPSWAALRIGSSWSEITAEPPLAQEDSFLIWFMSPECLDCQAKTSFINKLASQPTTVIALTETTSGRVAEYIYDWEPSFKLHRISSDLMKRYGLSLGTLIHVESDRVSGIWELDDFEMMDELLLDADNAE